MSSVVKVATTVVTVLVAAIALVIPTILFSAASASADVAPLTCTITDAQWTTEDTAPTSTATGFEFTGPSVAAIDTYQRATGNMQGITGMSYTIAAGETGRPAQLVVEVDPNAVLNAGGSTVDYATISTNFPAGSSGVLDAQDALWSSTKIAYGATNPGSLGDPISWSAMIALMPNNTLISAPSLHLQTSSTAQDSSTVTEVKSSCGTSSLAWSSVMFPTVTFTPASCASGASYTLPEPPANTQYEPLNGSQPAPGAYVLPAGQTAGPFILDTVPGAHVQSGSVTFGPFMGADRLPSQTTDPAGACYVGTSTSLAFTGDAFDYSAGLSCALALIGVGAVALTCRRRWLRRDAPKADARTP